jgi:hypothetical protein
MAAALGVVVMLFLVLVWANSPSREARRKLRAASAEPIASLEDGMVSKVCGVVKTHRQLLRAPITRRRCVVSHVYVEARGVFQEHWQLVAAETSGVDFLLEDNTGTALVSTEGCRAALVDDVENGSGLFSEIPSGLQRFLKKRKIPEHTALGMKRQFRFREGVVEPGEVAAVMGVVSFARDSSPDAKRTDYRSAARRATLSGNDESPLLVSDRPDVIDADERRLVTELESDEA